MNRRAFLAKAILLAFAVASPLHSQLIAPDQPAPHKAASCGAP